ncbi:predicted protein [Chaetomium globosum CBS 148.51]|uniref:Uncharacterized protein n=1 Tax=Chaetomium globosum (strain ATCC 6205 / CBS 148.51 / DSM 1962 / NBRC 6347 / NRRL 1970) TaxID=306901 RepID=Q2GS07_CHAGB|nr:uncharacterized protein CHGG_09247 [Chaetomium globosum CBS 148.51]EAQ85233.1 predicted protein [Chaetomium globosum CBS 148.51]
MDSSSAFNNYIVDSAMGPTCSRQVPPGFLWRARAQRARSLLFRLAPNTWFCQVSQHVVHFRTAGSSMDSAQWSSGMIRASGGHPPPVNRQEDVRGLGFDPRLSPSLESITFAIYFSSSTPKSPVPYDLDYIAEIYQPKGKYIAPPVAYAYQGGDFYHQAQGQATTGGTAWGLTHAGSVVCAVWKKWARNPGPGPQHDPSIERALDRAIFEDLRYIGVPLFKFYKATGKCFWLLYNRTLGLFTTRYESDLDPRTMMKLVQFFLSPYQKRNSPDDIVQSMTTEWQRLRNKNRRAVNRGQDSAKAYNLETFLIKWVRGHMGAQHLAAALRDPRVKEALETAGIKITDTQEEDGDVFRSSTIRKEMKALLTTDPFNDFKPYAGQDDNAATIADFCSTS